MYISLNYIKRELYEKWVADGDSVDNIRVYLLALQGTNKANKHESITVCRRFASAEGSLVKAVDHLCRFDFNIETLYMEKTMLADKITHLVGDEKNTYMN